MADSSIDAIVKAIVHLNFDEPAQALEVLMTALSDFNFAEIRFQEIAHGHRPADA